ncbi:MAG: CRISPR-associated protein Cas4 [Nanoarchaeota archaeon]|nr:CRISPR-associated protein Cas4 [Nanoarchaeota archaeon]
MTKINDHEIKTLSVSDISDYLCPTRRDLYFKKGKNKPRGIKINKTWGGIAGNLFEKYLINLYENEKNKGKRLNYNIINNVNKKITNQFKIDNGPIIENLESMKGKPSEDSKWFLKLLLNNGNFSISEKTKNRILSANSKNMKIINEKDILIKEKYNPNELQIGISRGSEPDYIIPSHNIVGDIKTGILSFKDYYLYTCTGYALAYENAMGQGNNINYGIILFFPTRSNDFTKPISFSQIYVFVIDDEQRGQFKRRRNEAYGIISNNDLPKMPNCNETSQCAYCQYSKICHSIG